MKSIHPSFLSSLGIRLKEGCREHYLGLFIFLIMSLAGMDPGLMAAAPNASLSVSDSTPDRGSTITITGNYSDSDGNLHAATIRNLGTGNKSGNLGSFPSIGTAGESISGSSDSIQRSFTFPVTTPLGTYTFRTEVVDTNSASDVAWKTVNVQNSKPTVSLSLSSTSITPGGSVTATATASDADGTIASVKFYRNNALVKTDTSSPYNYTYSSASAGTHAFKATAVDNDGATKTSPTKTVTVNTAPVVTSFPVSDSTPDRGSTITITGNYTDANSNLNAATIRNLGTGNKSGNLGSFPSIGAAGESITGSPDSIQRNFTFPVTTPLSTYTFRTEVADTNSASDIAWKTVNVQNSKPTVSLSLSSTSITPGGSVTATATASDVDGTISQVSFFRDALLQATDTTSSYDYTYSPASAGEHPFQATAVDNDGGTATSSVVTVTVNTAPVASLLVDVNTPPPSAEPRSRSPATTAMPTAIYMPRRYGIWEPETKPEI